MLARITDRVLLDIDDTIVEVHRYGKQGSGYGYSGVRGLNTLLATASTAQAAPVVVAQRLRKGSCGSPRGAMSRAHSTSTRCSSAATMRGGQPAALADGVPLVTSRCGGATATTDMTQMS